MLEYLFIYIVLFEEIKKWSVEDEYVIFVKIVYFKLFLDWFKGKIIIDLFGLYFNN